MTDLWNGETYHAHSKLQEKLATDFLAALQKIFPVFPAQSQILDVGCGDGLVTSKISQFFPLIETIGIDSSADMVQFATQNFKSADVRFQVDNAEVLKTIGDTEIAAVVSFNCLLWVQDLKRAFKAIHRVLKPGGWIGLLFPAEDHQESAIDDAYAQVTREDAWKTYFSQTGKEINWNCHDLEAIRGMLLTVGFELQKIEFHHWSFPFENKTALRNLFAAGFQQ